MIIAADEATHVDFLQKGLIAAGAVPVEPCTYSFPLDTVESSVATASVLEGVGVTAYLGMSLFKDSTPDTWELTRNYCRCGRKYYE